jgi:hypothetical protein
MASSRGVHPQLFLSFTTAPRLSRHSTSSEYTHTHTVRVQFADVGRVSGSEREIGGGDREPQSVAILA